MTRVSCYLLNRGYNTRFGITRVSCYLLNHGYNMNSEWSQSCSLLRTKSWSKTSGGIIRFTCYLLTNLWLQHGQWHHSRFLLLTYKPVVATRAVASFTFPVAYSQTRGCNTGSGIIHVSCCLQSHDCNMSSGTYSNTDPPTLIWGEVECFFFGGRDRVLFLPEIRTETCI